MAFPRDEYPSLRLRFSCAATVLRRHEQSQSLLLPDSGQYTKCVTSPWIGARNESQIGSVQLRLPQESSNGLQSLLGKGGNQVKAEGGIFVGSTTQLG